MSPRAMIRCFLQPICLKQSSRIIPTLIKLIEVENHINKLNFTKESNIIISTCNYTSSNSSKNGNDDFSYSFFSSSNRIQTNRISTQLSPNQKENKAYFQRALFEMTLNKRNQATYFSLTQWKTRFRKQTANLQQAFF